MEKIEKLLMDGTITIEDLLAYAQRYMDAVDRYDDEQLFPDNEDYESYDADFHIVNDEMDLDLQEPEYDGAGFMEDDRFNPDMRSSLPEYIIASTSYRLEETYVFEANAEGQITNYGEYGGIAKRFGNDDWTNRDLTVQTMFPDRYQFVKHIDVTNNDVYHSLYRRISK